VLEEERTEHIEHWLNEKYYGLGLSIQPLDEEPDVSVVALGVFKELIKYLNGIHGWQRRQLQMAAVDARHLALILHGYLRMPVAEEDLSETTWTIFLQYQALPVKSTSYVVSAQTREEAIDKAQNLCLVEHKCRGVVRILNGIPVEGAE
jgi:hypothetical protein